MKEEKIREAVRDNYGRIAKGQSSCCCAPAASCCGSAEAEAISEKIGYSAEDLQAVPDGANLGLGCGNPVALASLRQGETVVDLGSGAGIDCFLAASKVGKQGRVIGVDMTAEMLARARANAQKGGHDNVEFRLGEIENLPVADNTADVVISNCVINLSPDKGRVFAEALRVLRPGGRLMVSDMVLLRELPDYVKDSVEAYVGCVSGAILKDEYLGAMKAAGFRDVTVLAEAAFPAELVLTGPIVEAMHRLNIPAQTAEEIAESVASIQVHAVKPE